MGVIGKIVVTAWIMMLITGGVGWATVDHDRAQIICRTAIAVEVAVAWVGMMLLLWLS